MSVALIWRPLHACFDPGGRPRRGYDNSRTHTAVVNRAYAGSGLQMQLTAEDPGTFTRPFTASVTYRKANGDWPEVVCAENPGNYFAGRNTRVPVAARPDF